MKRKVNISSIEASNLAGKSFLPEELPPCFSSIQLGSYFKNLTSSEKRKLLEKGNQKHRVEQIDTYGARYGGLLRSYSTPSPSSFLKLSYEFERSKAELSEHLGKTNLSVSLPTTKHSYRGLGLTYKFSDLEALKKRYASTNPWLLKVDIANFYPSVYTHSISWALHGKIEAKNKIGKWHLLGNRLDKYISNGQYGETRGIPIGPDTSRLISEVILSPIDVVLQNNNARGIRFMDDYALFCKSKDEAEELLGVLQIELMKNKLNVNAKKTDISTHDSNFKSEWVLPLNKEIPKNPHTLKAHEKYQSLVKEYANRYPHTPAIKYIFSCIKNHTKFKKINLEYLDLLIECVDQEPALIPAMIKFLFWTVDKTNTDYSGRFIDKFEEWMLKCIRLGYQIELCWMLWFSLQKEWNLKKEIMQKVANVESNFITLLILALEEKNLININNLTPFDEMISLHDKGDNLSDWLLRYQCALQGWIDPEPIKKLDLWELYSNEVSFFHQDIGDTSWFTSTEESY